MIRAPFLTAIIAPMIVGTLLAVIIQGRIDILACCLATVMGLALHVATNVYNDIFDHIQGTDRVNDNRNDFSGGSGVLQTHPQLMPTLFLIARLALVVAFCAAIGLHALLSSPQREVMWLLFALGAFFSKYYTAKPVMLASRGAGELSVLLAFGPMALLLPLISQGVWLETSALVALPITGFSTLSILLIGQLIDLPADRKTGKLGVAARAGTFITAYVYLATQIATVINILLLAAIVPEGWPLYFAPLPQLFLLPKIWNILKAHHDEPKKLIPAAGLNIQLHLFSSLALILGLIAVLIVG